MSTAQVLVVAAWGAASVLVIWLALVAYGQRWREQHRDEREIQRRLEAQGIDHRLSRSMARQGARPEYPDILPH